MAERYDEQYRGDRDRGGRGNERGFMERAGDEVKSWFGDDDAERRRHMDDPQRDRDRDGFRERQLGQNTEYRRGQEYRGQDFRSQDYRGQENRGAEYQSQEFRGQRYGGGDDYNRSRPSGGGVRGISEYGSRSGSNYDTGQSGSNYGAGSNYGPGANYGYNLGGSYGPGYSSYGPGSSQGFQGYGQGTGGRASYGQGNRDFGQHGADADRGRGSFAGRGPKGYQRSDARISEDVCDRLAESPDVDASNIEVKVENGEVTLAGSVAERGEKRRAEDLIENISGVREVHNHLRVNRGQGGQHNQDEGLGRTSVLGLNTGPNAGATGGTGSTDRPTNVTAGTSDTGASATGASASGASTSAAVSTGDSANPGITGGGPSGATDISNTSASSPIGKTSAAGGRR
jgi:osmotically-inducible protein OsmY